METSKHSTRTFHSMSPDLGTFIEQPLTRVVSFMERLNLIFRPDAVLSDACILRLCHMTNRIDSRMFSLDATRCQVVDVGGSKANRSSWAECAQDVDIVIFVVSLTGYCQYVSGDTSIVSLFPLSFSLTLTHTYCFRIECMNLCIYSKKSSSSKSSNLSKSSFFSISGISSSRVSCSLRSKTPFPATPAV